MPVQAEIQTRLWKHSLLVRLQLQGKQTVHIMERSTVRDIAAMVMAREVVITNREEL